MQLPVGYDDFGKIVDKGLNYVDKSLFIKDILDDINTEAIVITRPRRFGKTFNLSMLHYFLSEKVYGNYTKNLFNQLTIFQCGDGYMQHQGKYPVVSISFKDIKQSSFSHSLEKIHELIIKVYDQHTDIEKSDKLTETQKRLYGVMLRGEPNQSQLEYALQVLMECLYAHHGIKPWLLIDEYDTPIQSAYAEGYYDEMIKFMRGMLSAALKNNPYLNKAVITGILRLAKESLFSGVNNLKVHSILSQSYSNHFGFTESEVDSLLNQSHLSDKATEIKQWYNGYQVGQTTIYNPWSIVNCIQEKGTLKPYWVNTSDNQLLKDLLKKSPLDFKQQFERLMSGDSTERLIDENMVFSYLETHPSAVWSLLLMSGYLTPIFCEEVWDGTLCQLKVPNREVNNLYRQIVGLWLSNGYGLDWYNRFMTSLISGQIDTFCTYLERVMLQIVSFHDLAKEPEAFFHGLLLGCIAGLQDTYEIKSNREAGLGRYDIILLPKDISNRGIVMELKNKKTDESNSLEEMAEKALKQIDERRYTTEFKQRGISRAMKIGIGFKGKAFVLRYSEEIMA